MKGDLLIRNTTVPLNNAAFCRLFHPDTTCTTTWAFSLPCVSHWERTSFSSWRCSSLSKDHRALRDSRTDYAIVCCIKGLCVCVCVHAYFNPLCPWCNLSHTMWLHYVCAHILSLCSWYNLSCTMQLHCVCVRAHTFTCPWCDLSHTMWLCPCLLYTSDAADES